MFSRSNLFYTPIGFWNQTIPPERLANNQCHEVMGQKSKIPDIQKYPLKEI